MLSWLMIFPKFGFQNINKWRCGITNIHQNLHYHKNKVKLITRHLFISIDVKLICRMNSIFSFSNRRKYVNIVTYLEKGDE